MKKLDDYKDLRQTFNYDKPKATRLAEAINECRQLEARITYLKELVMVNSDLRMFLWTTSEGVTKAIHDLEDDHIENILRHITRNGGNVSPQMIAEAESRGIDTETIIKGVIMLNSGEDDDDEDYEWDN